MPLVIYLPPTYSHQKRLVVLHFVAVRFLYLVCVPTELDLTYFRRFSLMSLQPLSALCLLQL